MGSLRVKSISCSITSIRYELVSMHCNDSLTNSMVVYMFDENLLLVEPFYLREKKTDDFSIELGKCSIMLQYQIPI